MRPIHPFPARMAPDTIVKWLDELPEKSLVLDPMCGSGVVLRQSLARGHSAIGFDVDPLAVLMSRVWTNKGQLSNLTCIAREIVHEAKRRRATHASLPWVGACRETKDFVEYWFAAPQRDHLARIAHVLLDSRNDLTRQELDGLLIALSRIIVTKQAGASLAWDVSHSRPHKVREENDFDVYSGFVRSADRLAELMKQDPIKRSAKVHNGDCRSMQKVKTGTVDAVVTSPPYLNAIDYLRGHKLALIWMGYSIPRLRELRAGAVGTENTGKLEKSVGNRDVFGLEEEMPEIKRLPIRQRMIVHKYARDASDALMEIKRVLKPRGKLVLVLADSVVRGVEVRSSSIFGCMAEKAGFSLKKREIREIAQNKRYLPIDANGKASLDKRMRSEIIQTFALG